MDYENKSFDVSIYTLPPVSEIKCRSPEKENNKHINTIIPSMVKYSIIYILLNNYRVYLLLTYLLFSFSRDLHSGWNSFYKLYYVYLFSHVIYTT